MFKKMPFVLLMMILAIILAGPYIPLEIKNIFYTISLNIKSLLVFILPVIIFGLLFKSILNLSTGASKIILMIISLVCISNILSTMIGYSVGNFVYSFDLSLIKPLEQSAVKEYFLIDLPVLIPNNVALFGAIICGLLTSKFWLKTGAKIAYNFERGISLFLNAFVYIIPLFIAGFIFKMEADGVILYLCKNYALIFVVIASAQLLYVGFLYYCLCGFKFNHFITNIRNMIPASICAFSSMSSAATMPLTLIGTEKNCENKELCKSVIPATVNIHMIGDCILIPVLTYALLKSFGLPSPTFPTYLIFTFYFVLARFSVAAIPGGGIIISIPLLEKYFGFDSQMLSLITALHILFDSAGTCTNVLGNGAFAKLIDKIVLLNTPKTNIIDDLDDNSIIKEKLVNSA